MKRSRSLLLFLLSILPLVTGGTALADIYKYRDAEGRIYFTDERMGRGYKLIGRFSGGRAVKPARSRIDTGSFHANRLRYSPLIEEVARETRIRPELLHAVVRAESAYDPKAVSRAGAVGLMQLMPGTAQRYGVSNREDPGQNLRGGALYLRDLLQRFDYDLRLALAAYNAGENAVERHGNQIPPIEETRNYVRKVMIFFQENNAERNS